MTQTHQHTLKHRHKIAFFAATAILAVTFAILAAATLSPQIGPPLDADGNDPQTIAIAFLENLIAGDLDKAKTHWDSSSATPTTEQGQRFVAFSQPYLGADRYTFSPARRGKGEWWHVKIEIYKNDRRIVNRYLYLSMTTGKWRLSREYNW